MDQSTYNLLAILIMSMSLLVQVIVAKSTMK